MPFLPQRLEGEADGDLLRRRARFTGILFLVFLASAIWLFARSEPIWLRIMPLEGGIFLLASALFGGLLASTPVLTLVFLLMTVWYGVESVFSQRLQRTPLLDMGIIAGGVLVWFSPGIALIAGAARAVLTGSIAFSRPQRVYFLESDPIAFWQSIGFMLIVAVALSYPSWQYWKTKYAKRRSANY